MERTTDHDPTKVLKESYAKEIRASFKKDLAKGKESEKE